MGTICVVAATVSVSVPPKSHRTVSCRPYRAPLFPPHSTRRTRTYLLFLSSSNSPSAAATLYASHTLALRPSLSRAVLPAAKVAFLRHRPRALQLVAPCRFNMADSLAPPPIDKGKGSLSGPMMTT